MANTWQAGRRIGVGLALAAAALALSAQAQAQEEKVLNIYNWSDYIGDDTIKNFEKETGIKVRYDVFDNNEILNAKLVAGKSGYDIVVPTAQWARLQIDAGLLRKLDKSKLTNLGNLDQNLQAKLSKIDPNNDYLVDWLWGYTTVGINVNKVKAALGGMPMPENAWDLIFDPKYAAKLKSCGVSFLDSPSEVLPAALQYLGKPAYSKAAADYQEAGKVLQAIRPYVTLFSSSGYINDMANGSVCVALGWSGDINIARQRAIDAKNGNVIQVLVPKTAALMFDTMAIPADAPHPTNAHLFINYILRPQVHASLSNKVFYANPNPASIKYVRKDIGENKAIFLSDADKQRMAAPEATTADIRRLMTRIYTKFKTGV
ncbi:polyamine ABC transporter substrate-binding protein [Janthinobacterium rivuli]|uniref:Putrescine-binding periplasmic protein n=1 Tax=Janthinobacterium rivuli TaxID=2751478 RepID=A0ABY8IBK9_9BURK|nr:polyamine ABC transporter substrate-binding protein [Janthinobacterium rivuli]WFR81726.1 polyamine ABC transporter substrate-binding protein [Janthinobacterium rivuli]